MPAMLYRVSLAGRLMMWHSLKVTFPLVPIHLAPSYHSQTHTYTLLHAHSNYLGLMKQGDETTGENGRLYLLFRQTP